jgi:hypothetical protein
MQESLERLFAGENGSKLTSSNIDTLGVITDEQIDKAYENLSKEEQEAFGSAAEFRRVTWEKIYAAEAGIL